MTKDKKGLLQQETWVVGVKERGAKSKTGGEERLKRPCVSS